MSHIHQGPLATYNSLTDKHLAGYYGNSRIRRHLVKSGLINHRGHLITENQYRINMARKEHKKHVKDLLAQAIVHKTLDMERYRQVEIRKKLEEIAKIEVVRRVRLPNLPPVYDPEQADRHHKHGDHLLPLLSPKSRQAKAVDSIKKKPGLYDEMDNFEMSDNLRPSSVLDNAGMRGRKGDEEVLPYLSPHSSRPMSEHPQEKISIKYRPQSAPGLSRNGYVKQHHDTIHVDEDGKPVTPPPLSEQETERKIKKDEIDSRHLYSLDSTSLQKYAHVLSRHERGGAVSPYLFSQIPTPPQSTRTRSARRRTKMVTSPQPPKEKKTKPVKGSLMLHRHEPAMMHQGEVQSFCEITMKYHGPNLTLPRDQNDPTQDVSIEQQHCGGNTLQVFRERLKPGSIFTFVSRRHRGYPFSLTLYIDGRTDCRVSTCCEYKHAIGVKLGGKMGHFTLVEVDGATPCYKCKLSVQASPRTWKSNKKAEPITEEVTVNGKQRTPVKKSKEDVSDEVEECEEEKEREEKEEEEVEEEENVVIPVEDELEVKGDNSHAEPPKQEENIVIEDYSGNVSQNGTKADEFDENEEEATYEDDFEKEEEGSVRGQRSGQDEPQMDAYCKETLNLKLYEDASYRTTSVSGEGISVRVRNTQYTMSMAVLEWDSEGETVAVKRYQTSDLKTAIPCLSRSLENQEHRSHSLINSAKAEFEYSLPHDLVGSKVKYVHGPIEESESMRSFSPVNNMSSVDMSKAQSRRLFPPIRPKSSNRSPSHRSQAQSSRPESISIQGMDGSEDSSGSLSLIMVDEILERQESAKSPFEHHTFSTADWVKNRKTYTKIDTKQQETVVDPKHSASTHEKELPDIKGSKERSKVDMELLRWKHHPPLHDSLCKSSSDTDSEKRKLKAKSKKEKKTVSVDQTEFISENKSGSAFDLSDKQVKILIDKEDSAVENMPSVEGHIENAEMHSDRDLTVEVPTAEKELGMFKKQAKKDEPIMIEVSETEKTAVGEKECDENEKTAVGEKEGDENEKTAVGEKEGDENNVDRVILKTELEIESKELPKEVEKKFEELNQEEVGVAMCQNRAESAKDKEKLDLDTADEVSDIETDIEPEITVTVDIKKQEELFVEDEYKEITDPENMMIKSKHMLDFESVDGVQLRRKCRKPKKQKHVSNEKDEPDYQGQERLKLQKEILEHSKKLKKLRFQKEMMEKSIKEADKMRLQREKREREMKKTEELRSQREMKEQIKWEEVEMKLKKELIERQYASQHEQYRIEEECMREQLRQERLKAEEELAKERLEQERHCLEQDISREWEKQKKLQADEVLRERLRLEKFILEEASVREREQILRHQQSPRSSTKHISLEDKGVTTEDEISDIKETQAVKEGTKERKKEDKEPVQEAKAQYVEFHTLEMEKQLVVDEVDHQEVSNESDLPQTRRSPKPAEIDENLNYIVKEEEQNKLPIETDEKKNEEPKKDGEEIHAEDSVKQELKIIPILDLESSRVIGVEISNPLTAEVPKTPESQTEKTPEPQKSQESEIDEESELQTFLEPQIEETSEPQKSTEPQIEETPEHQKIAEPQIKEQPELHKSPEPKIEETPKPQKSKEPQIEETTEPQKYEEPQIEETPEPHKSPEPQIDEMEKSPEPQDEEAYKSHTFPEPQMEETAEPQKSHEPQMEEISELKSLEPQEVQTKEYRREAKYDDDSFDSDEENEERKKIKGYPPDDEDRSHEKVEVLEEESSDEGKHRMIEGFSDDDEDLPHPISKIRVPVDANGTDTKQTKSDRQRPSLSSTSSSSSSSGQSTPRKSPPPHKVIPVEAEVHVPKPIPEEVASVKTNKWDETPRTDRSTTTTTSTTSSSSLTTETETDEQEKKPVGTLPPVSESPERRRRPNISSSSSSSSSSSEESETEVEEDQKKIEEVPNGIQKKTMDSSTTSFSTTETSESETEREKVQGFTKMPPIPEKSKEKDYSSTTTTTGTTTSTESSTSETETEKEDEKLVRRSPSLVGKVTKPSSTESSSSSSSSESETEVETEREDKPSSEKPKIENAAKAAIGKETKSSSSSASTSTSGNTTTSSTETETTSETEDEKKKVEPAKRILSPTPEEGNRSASESSSSESETETTETEDDNKKKLDPVKPRLSPTPEERKRSDSESSSSESETETTETETTETEDDKKKTFELLKPRLPPTPEERKRSDSESSRSESETETTETETTETEDDKKKTFEPLKPRLPPTPEERKRSDSESSSSGSETETTETETTETEDDKKKTFEPLKPRLPPTPEERKRSDSESSSSESETETTETETTETEDDKKKTFEPLKPRLPPTPEERKRSDSESSSSGSETETTETETTETEDDKKKTFEPLKPRLSPTPEEKKKYSSSSSSESETETTTETETEDEKKRKLELAKPRLSPTPEEKKKSSHGSSSSESESETETDTERKKRGPAPVTGLEPPKPVVTEASKAKKSSSSGSEDSSEDSSSSESESDTETASERDVKKKPVSGQDPNSIAKGESSGKSQLVKGSLMPMLLRQGANVDLNSILLSSEQVAELANYISEKDELHSLVVHNAGLSDDSFKRIALGLKVSACKPELLNFTNNNLGEASMTTLVDILRTKPSVKTVLLHGNPLGDDGCKKLADGMIAHTSTRDRPTLRRALTEEEMWIEPSEYVTPTEERAKRASKQKGPEIKLKTLDLGETGMTDLGIEAIANMLEKDGDVEELDLNQNSAITLAGWSRLGRALETNATMKILSLDNNPVGDDGIQKIADGLRQNMTLRSLELENVGMSDRGGKALLSLLTENSTISTMTIYPGNIISESVQNGIKKYLALNAGRK